MLPITRCNGSLQNQKKEENHPKGWNGVYIISCIYLQLSLSPRFFFLTLSLYTDLHP